MLNFDESISAQSEIAAPTSAVWEQITKPGGVVKWHPFVKKNTTEHWNGIGSKDHVVYFSGRSFEREIVDWMEGTGYNLKLTENGKNEALAEYRITPINANRCRFKVTVRIQFIKNLPFPIRWVLLKFKIKPLFTEYLTLSMPGFVSCAETGKQVERNQFGSHPVFSPEI
ncbi:SRPBCC family protein [Desulfobacterales bacterium HSG16]|nr:SRPBCC family protein [Desulfobacterales bacterium HSG16]